MTRFRLPDYYARPAGLRDRGRPIAPEQPLTPRLPARPDPLASGLMAAASALDEIGGMVKVQMERDERLSIARTIAEERDFWTKDLAARQENAAPGGEGFAKDVISAFDERKQSIFENKPLSAKGREELELRLLNFRGDLSEKATNFETGARLAKRGEDADVVLRLAAADAARDPGNIAARISDAESAMRNLGLPPLLLDKKLKEARESIARSGLTSLIDQDPAAGLAAINSGGFTAYIDPERMASLRHYAAAEGKRARAEGEARRREARAEIRVGVALQLADAEAAWGRGEIYDGPLPTEESIRGAFIRPEEAEHHINRLRLGREEAATAAALRLVTPEQRIALVEKRKPQGEGYAREAEGHDRLMRLTLHLNKEQQEDPAGFVMRSSPALRNLVNEAAKLQDGGDMAGAKAARDKAMALSLELQAGVGVPEHQRRIMPKPLAQSRAEALAALPAELPPNKQGQTKAEGLAAVRDSFGERWPQAFRELREAGLADEFEGLALLEKNPGARLLFAESLNQPKAVKEAAGPEAKKARDALHGEMADMRESLMLSPDGATALERMMKQGELLAYGFIGQGDNGPTAARKAAAALVREHYDFWKQPGGVTARLPKGATANVQALAERQLLGLRPEMLADPGGDSAATLALTPDQRKAQMVSSLQNGALWLTNGKEDGLMLFDSLMRPVKRADGSNFEIKFGAGGYK